jgi:hypothetical protein
VVSQYNQVSRCADEDAISAYFDSRDSSSAPPLAAPVAFSPEFSDSVEHGVEYRRAGPVPAGMYYVVIDNSLSALYVVAPAQPAGGLGDAAAVGGALDVGGRP